MNLDFQAGGSPLASRQNPLIYAAILLAGIIIAVFFLLYIIQKKLKEHHSTPEWIKHESERNTKKKDIMEFADKYVLSQAESLLLWRICKKYEIRNILFSIKHFADIDGYFKMYYDELSLQKNKEHEINLMFTLKFKLEKIFASSEIVSSTRYLVKDQRISEIFPDGTKQPFKVFENQKEFIEIQITEDFFNSSEKPAPMDKVAFTFHSNTGMRYAFVSRLIRYENGANGIRKMLISHSSDLIVKQARNFKRVNTNESCKICSVKVETDKKGRKSVVYGEKKYDCALLNISGGGCCISTNLPVKEGQLICSEITVPNGTVSVIGKIIKTRKSKTEGLYNLHIQFTRISIESQNKLLAKVYNYF